MPLAFPVSGNVYSREVSHFNIIRGAQLTSLKAMEDMAARNDGCVTDPRSGERCAYGDLRRVFIS